MGWKRQSTSVFASVYPASMTCSSIRSASPILAMGPIRTRNKSCPLINTGEILTGPQEFLKGLYRGWLDGGGHARRNGEHGKTISKKLACAMFNLDVALGNNLQP